MVKSKFYKVSALALTLSLVVGTSVFASTSSINGGSKNRIHFSKSNFNIKSKWDSLVTAGTITQADETAAVALFTPPTGVTRVNPIKTKLDALVTSGTITSDQETAILNLSKKKAKGGIETGLDGLVTAGTITSAQETSIITALTPAKTRVNPMKTKLDTLVTAGTITSDQETAMLNALKPAKHVKTSSVQAQ